MAISVEFEGWVNDIKRTDWGAFVTVAHDQRAKNQQTGEWETVGKDYIDVSVNAELLPIVESAKLIRVSGNLKASAYVGKDGTAKPALKVNAQEIAPVERGQRDAAATLTKSFGATPVDEEMPF